MSVPRLKRAQLRERERERERAAGAHNVTSCCAVLRGEASLEATKLSVSWLVRLRLRVRLPGSGLRLGAVQKPKRFRALRWQHPRSNKTRTVRVSYVCVPRLHVCAWVCVCVQNWPCLCVCVCCVRGVENWLHFKNPQDAEQNVKRKGKSKRRRKEECVARNQSKV